LTEIKSIPYVPLSHPFVERLIGTLRREYLDHLLFWTTTDLENKLLISGPALTTIARIPHGKGEHPIYPSSWPWRIFACAPAGESGEGVRS